MTDVSIKKTMKRSTTFGQATSTATETIELSAADTVDNTHPNIVARWNPERIEIIGKKELIETIRPVAWSQFASKDPQMKVYDWKKIKTVFRVKGKLIGTTWNEVAQIMHYMLLIFGDGGAFEFTWNDDTFNVNVFDYQFYNEKREGIFTIPFTIDLIKADSGTGI